MIDSKKLIILFYENFVLFTRQRIQWKLPTIMDEFGILLLLQRTPDNLQSKIQLQHLLRKKHVFRRKYFGRRKPDPFWR